MADAILTPRKKIGYAAESLACEHLESQGLICLVRNFVCRRGEIDIIMKEDDTLVFVEVRTRSRDDYGDAMETIRSRKQQSIQRAAHYYLLTKHWLDEYPCRFDAVSIKLSSKPHEVEWIKNAFWATNGLMRDGVPA